MADLSVCFPRLQRLILLERYIIRLDREEEPNESSPHTHRGPLNDDILALPALREPRLEWLTVPVIWKAEFSQCVEFSRCSTQSIGETKAGGVGTLRH